MSNLGNRIVMCTEGYKATLCGKIIGKRGNILVTFPKANGYYCFSQSEGKGNPNQTLVHRFVWSFWNGEIPEGMQVDHLDGDKSNNAIHNLQILSSEENTAKESLLLTQEQADYIKSSDKRGSDLAKTFGVSPQLVCCIKKGRRYNKGYGKEIFDERGRKKVEVG